MVKGKKGIGNMTRMILGIIAGIFLVLNGLASISNWDWSDWFRTIVLVVVGLYLVIESSVKNISGFTNMAKQKNGLIHLGSFVFGVLSIYIGIISIPSFGALALSSVEAFSGWIMFIAGILAVIEPFVR